MAAVYKAYQPGVERQVALKVLPRQLAKNPEFVARFKREAGVLAQLQHPHVLAVFDYGEADDYTYIVMPLLKSGTLSEQLSGDILSWFKIEQVISQLGSALDYAHSKGIIHRDIKPSNVLIDEQDNCLLTDFGIAKIISGEDEKLTGTGNVMGTPAYMSPEQGRGVELDQRSDIYSLGIILYEMVTGRVPYKAETPLAVMVKHLNDPLPPPRQINPNIPESIEFVIIKSLAKQREHRFETAGEMASALKKAIAQEPLTDSQLEDMATLQATATPTHQGAAQTIQTKQKEVPQKGGNLLLWGGVAVILLLLLGGGGAFLAMGGLNTANPEPTSVSQVTDSGPTSTPEEPIETPLPTDTPEPTATNTPVPTNTPVATHTPVSTNTPVPTNTPAPTNTPVPTITNTPTPVINTEFPIPDDVYNYFKAANDDDINFQTDLSVDELFEFYKQELTAQGLVEREINTTQWDGGFSIVFDGAENGKALVVQVVDLGASSATDARNVNIRYESI